MAHDKRFVRKAFADIAPRYDLLNTLLSAGVEMLWRRRAIRALNPRPGQRVLDLCAGTLTISRDLLKLMPSLEAIVSVDFCFEMLTLGQSRLSPWQTDLILPVMGDAESIPLKDGHFDSAIVTYGIRNLADRPAGLRELHRVLKPGGTLVILDFLRPGAPMVASAYGFYLSRVLPVIGGVISGSRDAYRHLSDSIETFLTPDELCSMLEDSGFRNARVKRLSLGIAGLFVAKA